MLNHFSSRASLPWRAAGLFALTSLAATSLVVGGCMQDGDSSSSTTGSDHPSTTGSGSPSSSTGPGGTTSSGGSSQPGPDLMAFFNEQVTDSGMWGKNAWLAPGEALDPKTLIMVIQLDGGPMCRIPQPNITTTTSFEELLIGLSPSIQKVGKYDVSSTDVIAFSAHWLGDGMGNGGGGGQPLNAGTVEVLSIDATAIKVHIDLGQGSAYTNDFVVPRCP